jgi:hypothetical protein
MTALYMKRIKCDTFLSDYSPKQHLLRQRCAVGAVRRLAAAVEISPNYWTDERAE